MRISVALMRNDCGQILLVRKRGTTAFMQPGGKIEAGEDAGAALQRELAEELSIMVDIGELQHLGSANAPAANEPGELIEAEVFGYFCNMPIIARAEIAEAVWVDPAAPLALPLAPLTRDHIIPLALRHYSPCYDSE